MQDVETNDVAFSTLWIVAFCISLAIHIICISATFISRRYDKKEVFLQFLKTHNSCLYFNF